MVKRRTKSRKSIGRRIAVVVALGLGLGAGVWGYRLMGSLVQPGTSLKDVWGGISNPRGQFASTGRPIILVIGKDYNHDRKGIAYTKDARADTIMLIAADLNGPKLAAVNIPRDTKVTAPDGITGKINGTFQRGGVDLLKRTIEDQFGVRADYHVVLKADAVKTMVDAVGGVEVEAIDRMFYEDYWGGLKIDLPAGRQRIDGQQAVGFVRFRKTGDHRVGPNGEKIEVDVPPSKEEGDIRRTERQQQLVRALAGEALKPSNLLRAPQLVDTAFGQVETDLTRTQVLALATLFKGSSGSMDGATIPGEDRMIRGTYYWDPDRERATLTFQYFLFGDEMAGRKLTRVAVYNASKTRGLAVKVAEALSSYGYTASAAGNSRDSVSEVVFRKAAYESAAKAIASQLGIGTVRKDTSDAGAIWLPEVKVTLTEEPAGLPDAG